MEETKLANALEKLAEATVNNTKLLEKIAEGGEIKKKSFDDIKKESSLVKIIYHTVQQEIRVGNKSTWKNIKTFKSKKDADEFIKSGIKGNGRIVIKVKYLSSNNINDEEQKGTDNGESFNL